MMAKNRVNIAEGQKRQMLEGIALWIPYVYVVGSSAANLAPFV